MAVTRAKPCSGYRSCSGPHRLFCVRSNIQGYDELFRLCCHTRPQKPSQSASRTFSASGYLPQCAGCRTRTGRPVRSPAILSPAHTSAVDGALSLPGQSVGMAMMCFIRNHPPNTVRQMIPECIRPTRKAGLQVVHAAKAFIVEHHIFWLMSHSSRSAAISCGVRVSNKRKGSSKLVT